MALVAADGTALLTAILGERGEDFVMIGRLLGRLETAYPAIQWRTLLSTFVNTYAPFTNSGLSKAWWLAAVGRYADSQKLNG